MVQRRAGDDSKGRRRNAKRDVDGNCDAQAPDPDGAARNLVGLDGGGE